MRSETLNTDTDMTALKVVLWNHHWEMVLALNRFLRCQLSWAQFSPKEAHQQCPLVVSETLLHRRRLVSVRSIQCGKWLNPKRSSPPSPSPQQQNIFPCGHALKIGIDSLDSPPRHLHYFLTGPISISFSELNHAQSSVTNGVTVGFVTVCMQGYTTNFASQV